MSLTIKQAFQKLAMVTGAAVKNPWFIGRNLNQAFADIAENVVDASGDKVVVTQTLTEGTEIGSIKVNNATTVLYAPAGGGGGGGGIDYSITEQDTGIKWIDGKTIYRRTYSFGYSIPNSGDNSFNLDGIGNMDSIINCWAIGGGGEYNGPVCIYNNNGVANVVACKNSSAYAEYLTVEYTKKIT